jgi:hypothetical protein
MFFSPKRSWRKLRKCIRGANCLPSNNSYQRRLHIESLEDRRVLTTLTVDTSLDVIDFNDNLLSLREAVFIANNIPGADTIHFSLPTLEERIELQLGEIEITESVTIDHQGISPISIDAAEQSRIFNITATTGDFVFSFLSLERGKTTEGNADDFDNTHSGGAIRSLTTGQLTFNRTKIQNSSTTGEYAKGGGVFAVGNVSLDGSSDIEENSTAGSYANGGGIFTSGQLDFSPGASIYLNETTGDFSAGGGAYVSNGLLMNGGSIYANSTLGMNSPGGGAFVQGNANINNGGITSNFTSGVNSKGGGIYLQNPSAQPDSNLVFSGGLLTNNQSQGHNSPGGAIYTNGTAELESLSILGNFTTAADSPGGAIYAQQAVSLLSSTLSGNFTTGSSSHGGAIYALSTLSLAHVTASENRLESNNAEGGGVFIGPSGSATLNHTILAGNIAQTTSTDIRLTSGTSAIQYSLVGSNQGSPLQEAPVGAPDASGNRIGGPIHGIIDARLFPLAFNEGTGDTYRPKPDSPAVNAGIPSAIAGSNGVPFFDQRGIGFPRVLDERIDIGAIELKVLKVDTLADENDGDHTVGDFSLREALALILHTKERDLITFDEALFANGPATIELTQGELEVVDKVSILGPTNGKLTISAEGNDPTPHINNGDGSRVFHIKSVAIPNSPFYGGTFPSLQISNVTLSGGDVDGQGGAIWVSPGTFVVNSNGAFVDDVLIVDNHATGNGGGIAVSSAGTLSINNSTLTNNTSNGDGGAISAHTASGASNGVIFRKLRVRHSTITQNLANRGGGITLMAGGALVENSIVAENSASSISQSDLFQESFSQYTNFDFSSSLIGIAIPPMIPIFVGGAPYNWDGTLLGVPSSPLDPRLGPLADNGGPTQTHALLPESPALNMGSTVTLATKDQRGQDRNDGNGVDMGAYESQITPSADFDSDGDVDGSDFLAWQRGFGTSNAQRADGNSDDDTDTDASDLAGWAVQYGQTGLPTLAASRILSDPTPTEGISDPTLINAALAWEMTSDTPEQPVTPIIELAINEALFTKSDTHPELFLTAKLATEVVLHNASESETDASSDPWLDDELLVRIFI